MAICVHEFGGWASKGALKGGYQQSLSGIDELILLGYTTCVSFQVKNTKGKTHP